MYTGRRIGFEMTAADVHKTLRFRGHENVGCSEARKVEALTDVWVNVIHVGTSR